MDASDPTDLPKRTFLVYSAAALSLLAYLSKAAKVTRLREGVSRLIYPLTWDKSYCSTWSSAFLLPWIYADRTSQLSALMFILPTF